METITLQISEIKPYFNNPKKHTDIQLRALKASIEEYGYNVPIVVDKDHVIISGHARYDALKALGYTEVTCVVASHLNDDWVREYRIADNSVSELSSWDDDALMQELKTIGEIQPLELCFDEATMNKIAGSVTAKSPFAVSDEGIKAIEAREKSAFQLRAVQRDYFEITCRECGKPIMITKGSVVR